MAAKRKKMTFETGMQELEALVDRLSGSELPLDEAIALYEQGKMLAKELESQLSAQQKRIDITGAHGSGSAKQKAKYREQRANRHK